MHAYDLDNSSLQDSVWEILGCAKLTVKTNLHSSEIFNGPTWRQGPSWVSWLQPGIPGLSPTTTSYFPLLPQEGSGLVCGNILDPRLGPLFFLQAREEVRP